MRLKALTLGYVLNTHIMGVECLENFLQALKGMGISNYMGLEVLFQREKANFHILVMKIRENSYKVTSTGVLWLETN